MFKTFEIIGAKFATEKSYYLGDKEKKYFYYEQIETKPLGTFKFKNLKDAEIFLIANYPEYYFGACIRQLDGTDFLVNAGASYYEMTFQTNDRAKIINSIASEI